MISPAVRRAVTCASMTAIAAMALACPGPTPPDPGGPDLYRVAVSGAPGGALLGVWGDPVGQRAFVAGGYVGVDPAMVSDGAVGRLVEYTGPGTFVTRCTTDHVLWWVHGVTDGGAVTVYASGEGGRVIRYRDGRCETLDLGLALPGGAPTLWGIDALAPNDVWFVGGSAEPTGPHGVVLRYDGTTFRQVTDLPPEAAGQNLYKLARWDAGLVVVGAGATVLQTNSTGGLDRVAVPVSPTGDNRLFTVSCQGSQCWAVGGSGAGIVLSGDTTGWRSPGLFDGLPGLNGVWMQDASNVFIVGVGGFTMHTNGSVTYQPPQAPTTATLHGVGGFGTTVLAVGGELDVRAPTQRAVILVRGDASARFTLDGRAYTATGSLRTSLGGTGQ